LKISEEVMIGNYAIARGLVEAGVELAAAYPGTPSSEILPGVLEFSKREQRTIHAEWSTNERCAFEAAFGAAQSGRKAACMMKQVGLNVAFPALLRGKGKVIEGGLVIVSCDDPGPQSSQTEQDTRLLAVLYGLPVFDPASPREASELAYFALQYSFEHKAPVILRSTHRVSHAREAIQLYEPGKRKVVLTEGLVNANSKLRTGARAGSYGSLGIVASGMTFSIAMDVLSDLGLSEDIPVYKVVRVYPLDQALTDFVKRTARVLVLEETDAVLEALIDSGDKVYGRRNGFAPNAGELTYDVVRGVVERAAKEAGMTGKWFLPDRAIEDTLRAHPFPPRPPKLCAGCPHRASFYAMRYAFPEAVFPGDIGCYTLGTAQGAVDTCLDMGSGVTVASGFYDTFAQDGTPLPILASVGDSTFFHAGLPPLYDAVKKGKKFVLMILDNGTTAMTGMQPTPQAGYTASGAVTRVLPIEGIVRGLGVGFLRIVDPYDVPLMIKTIKEAVLYLGDGGKGPAAVIARRECVLTARGRPEGVFRSVMIEKDCTGCKRCVNLFDCPALRYDETTKKMKVDEALCSRCGICLFACTATRQGKGLVTRKRPIS
jgi:indolepyruvate ferredoxin oxidoreductase, alpha subunit